MRVFALTLFVVLAACGTRDETASSSAPVVGGYFDQGAGPTVGIFRCDGACAFTPYLNPIEICSGTLIAPNLVLTARHCVAPQVNADTGVLCSVSTFGPAYPADNLIITPAKDVLEGGPWYVAREIDVDQNDGDDVCGNDVALLHLRSPYLGAAPMAPRLSTPPVAGEIYSAIGYGDDLDGGLGYRHRRDGLAIRCVGTACKDLGLDKKPLITQAELEGDTGLCGGDSGGPAVDLQGLLIGVTSRAVSNDCTKPVYSRVDSHAAWLQAQAVRAAQFGGYPLPPWAFATPPTSAPGDAGPDASVLPFDSGTPSGPLAGQAVGGCTISASPDASPFALLLLLRFARKRSRSSS